MISDCLHPQEWEYNTQRRWRSHSVASQKAVKIKKVIIWKSGGGRGLPPFCEQHKIHKKCKELIFNACLSHPAKFWRQSKWCETLLPGALQVILAILTWAIYFVAFSLLVFIVLFWPFRWCCVTHPYSASIATTLKPITKTVSFNTTYVMVFSRCNTP